MKPFDLNLIWKAFKAASTLANASEYPKALGITPEAYDALYAECGAFKEAVENGESCRANSTETKILESLSPEALTIWRDLKDIENQDKHVIAQLALAKGGDVMRQRMLALGLVETNFQVSRCLKLLKITKREMDKWLRDDPEFQELVAEIQFAKRNYAEDALFRLVGEGSEKAVLFANERLNREQYGNEIKVSGEIAHTSGTLDLAALDLPPALESAILDHLQNRGFVDSDGLLIDRS